MRGHHPSSLWKAGLTIVSAWLIFLSSAAAAAVSAVELQERLAADVQFLSQPALHGRKTRSAGARLARHYIGKVFQNSGLVPWAKAKHYELSFGLGKNVVGVVPGLDGNLTKEIVLLSAHYDHLGKDRKGRVCPGAADNASGVAVLLEAARRFGAVSHRSKRTIALAAFDAEEAMLLGSFAFSCRPDVEQANIVAVINVDMLGRDFLDTISNTVFLAGTEYYPDLQPAAGKLGGEAGLRVLTLGSDLIGPRSDHIAFEGRDIPCLFFSCGTFTDYHGPGDTAARLNYSTLRRSTEVILRTVELLAEGEVMPPRRRSGCDLRELRSMRTVVAELSRNPESAGIKTNDLKSLETLRRQLDRMAEAGAYTLRAREQLVMEATRTLGGYFLPFGDEAGSGARRTA